jgi:hypothetical protein
MRVRDVAGIEPAPLKHGRRGNNRRTGREQFYTPRSVADLVVDAALHAKPEIREQLWVEPCAGTGNFLDAIVAAGIRRVWACDIEPRDPRVIAADFLESDLPVLLQGAAVVTNPPFGRNNSLSVPFFNRAATFASVIVFVVPRSWRKWSVINRLDPAFHLVWDQDLDVDYLDANSAPVSSSTGRLRTCVQIWERRSAMRERVVVEDRGYVARTDPLHADVRLTVFGAGAGTIKTEFDRVPNTTCMFLKVRDREVIDALRSVDYSRFFQHVAYTEALSLPEIRFLLNEHFDGVQANKAA